MLLPGIVVSAFAQTSTTHIFCKKHVEYFNVDCIPWTQSKASTELKCMINDNSLLKILFVLNKQCKKASIMSSQVFTKSVYFGINLPCHESHRSIFVLWYVFQPLYLMLVPDFIPLSSSQVPCLWQDNGEVLCPAVTVNTGFKNTSSHTYVPTSTLIR